MELSGIHFLDELEVENRRVLCRVDFNVPMEGTRVLDDWRIHSALPTIQRLRQAGAHLVLASHLGRPRGGHRDPALSLEPCAARLAELLDIEVRLADDCVGDGIEKFIADLPTGGVALLENLRFHAAERKGDVHFARALAAPFEVYVNDAFATCHRPDASIYSIVQFFQNKGAGLLVQREIEYLGQVLGNPVRPYVAVLGGSKVSEKVGVLQALIERCDVILVGGAMAYTFLRAQGHGTGHSLVEENMVDTAREILNVAADQRVEIHLPQDHVMALSLDAPQVLVCDKVDIPEDMTGFDIGPRTTQLFRRALGQASTVFWNGPLGVVEHAPYQEGTFNVARAIAESGATSVVGGRDTVLAARVSGVKDRFSHVSTGGVASLDFLQGKPMPGLEALRVGHQF
jgi:phosphoglycerate kinase